MRGVKMRYSPNRLMCGIETDLITTDYNNINDMVHFIIGGFYFFIDSRVLFCFGFFIFKTFIIL